MCFTYHHHLHTGLLFVNKRVLFVNKRVPFVNKRVLFVNKRVPFVNKRVLFVNKRVLFVNKRVPFVNKRVLFVNKRVLFVNKRVPFVNKRVLFVNKRVPFVNKRVLFVNKRVPFVNKRVLFVNKRVLFVNKRVPFVNKRVLFVNKRVPFVNKRVLFVNKLCPSFTHTHLCSSYIYTHTHIPTLSASTLVHTHPSTLTTFLLSPLGSESLPSLLQPLNARRFYSTTAKPSPTTLLLYFLHPITTGPGGVRRTYEFLLTLSTSVATPGAIILKSHDAIPPNSPPRFVESIEAKRTSTPDYVKVHGLTGNYEVIEAGGGCCTVTLTCEQKRAAGGDSMSQDAAGKITSHLMGSIKALHAKYARYEAVDEALCEAFVAAISTTAPKDFERELIERSLRFEDEEGGHGAHWERIADTVQQRVAYFLKKPSTASQRRASRTGAPAVAPTWGKSIATVDCR